MNDAGLSIASHEVFGPNVRRRFNRRGLTYALTYRRILEECTTVAEAHDLLTHTERATSTSLVCCDQSGGAVFEVTPDQVIPRPSNDGFAVCTNHFCTPELTNPRQRNTYQTIDRIHTLRNGVGAGMKLGIDDVRQRLNDVHQGDLTLHAMIFEPAAIRLHLSLGPPPASAQEFKTLDVASLLGNQRAPRLDPEALSNLRERDAVPSS
jgi:hypothetical protein